MVVNNNFSGAIHCRFGMHPETVMCNWCMSLISSFCMPSFVLLLWRLLNAHSRWIFLIAFTGTTMPRNYQSVHTERQTCTPACQAQCCNLVCGGIISLSNKKKTSLTNKNKDFFSFSFDLTPRRCQFPKWGGKIRSQRQHTYAQRSQFIQSLNPASHSYDHKGSGLTAWFCSVLTRSGGVHDDLKFDSTVHTTVMCPIWLKLLFLVINEPSTH